MAIVIDKTTIGSAAPADGASAAFTTNQAVASGGFIVVCIGYFGQLTLNSVTGGGLTWTVDFTGHPVGNPANVSLGIASAQAPAGLASSTTITANASGSMGGPILGGMSFTGVMTSSPVDGTPPAAVGVDPAAQPWSSATIAIAAGSVMVATSWLDNVAATNTITSPAIESYDTNPGSGHSGCGAYRIEASAGSYAIAGNWSSAQQSASAVVAYLAAAGGPAAQTLRPDADTTTTGWTATPLFSKIDESAADGTIITATAS